MCDVFHPLGVSIYRCSLLLALASSGGHHAHPLKHVEMLSTEPRAELLALFSSPRAPPGTALHLRPLNLGQELKLLLRAVPKSRIAIEPAASLADAAEAVRTHNPTTLLFSGHSVEGALAFELPNGRVDLPSPARFVEARPRSREIA